jgi:hypothetical protein
MDVRKSSAPAHPSTREQRGLALAGERAEEIWRCGPWVWRVPSCSDPETIYLVRLRPESCPCEDHQRTGRTCKHLFAALVVRAKYGVCSGCGCRFRHRDLVELTEDNHDDLTHFDGDRLCVACADGAGVAW